MFLKLDWGIIWPIVNIVVFYLLLRKFLFGPVSEVMEKRKKMISSDLDDAAQTKAEAEEIKQEYEKTLHRQRMRQDRSFPTQEQELRMNTRIRWIRQKKRLLL